MLTEPIVTVTAEVDAWTTHRDMTAKVERRAVGHRGAIGLALVIRAVDGSFQEIGDKMFVPDRLVRWAAIVDVPPGRFVLDGSQREVAWATVRPTSTRFGVPTLAFGTEEQTARGRAAWDFRRQPRREGWERAAELIFDGAADPQLFRTFNAISTAMTAVAVHHRAGWRAARPDYLRSVGLPDRVPTPVYRFGDNLYDGIAGPELWMPRAYLAFPESRLPWVFDQAAQSGGHPRYPRGMRAAMGDAAGAYLEHRSTFAGVVRKVTQETYRSIPVVAFELAGDRGESEILRFFRQTVRPQRGRGQRFAAGDAIAEEWFPRSVPSEWAILSVDERWDWLVKILDWRLDAVARLWFERQAVYLDPGLVHLPAAASSLAALTGAVDGHLYWDVAPATEYMLSDADAMVFPPVTVPHWTTTTGRLPGDVFFDLTPNDARYCPEGVKVRCQESEAAVNRIASLADGPPVAALELAAR